MRFQTHFNVNEELGGTFASFGRDHLCIVFFRGPMRVGSFVAEAPSRTEYLAESTGEITYGVSLADAIALAGGAA
jgi:hypothetical protein